MNFNSFKENVKQLLGNFKSDNKYNNYNKYNKIYNFIENYSVETQTKYNDLSLQLQHDPLVKDIVSLLDIDTLKMLFRATRILNADFISKKNTSASS
jgi:hypothetical protein